MLKQVIHIVTTVLYGVNILYLLITCLIHSIESMTQQIIRFPVYYKFQATQFLYKLNICMYTVFYFMICFGHGGGSCSCP
jgi:hypothetical protein